MKKIALLVALLASSAMAAKDEMTIGAHAGISQISVHPKIRTRWSETGNAFASEVALLKTSAAASQQNYYFDHMRKNQGDFGAIGGLRLGYACQMPEKSMGFGFNFGISGSGAKASPLVPQIGYSKTNADSLDTPGTLLTTYYSDVAMKFKTGLIMNAGPVFYAHITPDTMLGFGAGWQMTQLHAKFVQPEFNASREVTGYIKSSKKTLAHAVQLSFSIQKKLTPSVAIGVEANYALPANMRKFTFPKEFMLASINSNIKNKICVKGKVQSFSAMAFLNWVVNAR